MRNLFKDKNILALILPFWFDGTSYKLPNFFKKEFGINFTRDPSEIKGNIDLGICWGEAHVSYRKFMESNIPYILIEHDVNSLRKGMGEKNYAIEKEAIENAVAVIFTSEDHAEYYEGLKKKYNWHLPEYITVHNKPLKKDIKFIPKDKLEGLNMVYAGGAISLKEKSNYHYRDYLRIFGEFIKAGWKVHVYPCRGTIASRLIRYKDLGCIIHNWIPGDKIYQEMSQYTAGLHAYNRIDTPEMAFKYTQLCRPNKLYDYLASGIPTIGYQGGNGMEIYRDKWGIVIDDLEPETLAAIPERLKKIKITKKMRNDNVLEKERDKFEYIINVALKEAENKDRVKYNIGKNPFENTVSNPFAKKFPIKITVENKTPCIITRINRSFLPHSISEVFTIDKMDYKQLRAHVNLIIKEMEA